MFAIFDDVISCADCEKLKTRIESWHEHRKTIEPNGDIWNWYNRVLDVTPESKIDFHVEYERNYNLDLVMKELQENIYHSVIKTLQEKLNCTLEIQSAELQTWMKDTDGPIHKHGVRPNARRFSDYNSLLYLNDDFGGGEFYTENGITVKPKPGRLTFFDGSAIYHGVKQIYNNNRYTMIFWWKNTKFK